MIIAADPTERLQLDTIGQSIDDLTTYWENMQAQTLILGLLIGIRV